jgi:hypothetical protein
VTRWRESRLGASLDGRSRARELRTVESFCMFIGYPRSGHSLLGSLLDAHREVVIAHELDVLRLVAAGWPRHAIYSRLLNHDASFTASGRQWFGYDYSVPGQWQGRTSLLRVIGDKKGGKSTEQLGRQPGLLDRLRTTIGVPLRVVHVVRSPFDNITTMARRSGETLEQSTERFFALCAAVSDIKGRLSADELLDVRHEALVADPRVELRRACRFLGVEPDGSYLDACANAVFSAPRQSRRDLPWNGALVERVAEEASRYGFFDGYTYVEEQRSR